MDLVRMDGDIELQKTMERISREIAGPATVGAIKKGALLVTRAARVRVPVDTGRVRASIVPKVGFEAGMVGGVQQTSVRGVVGSNVAYAPFLELGTRPHWPPVAALEVWARRHHVSAFLVARAISRRGTKSHKFLESSLESNRSKIVKLIEDAVNGAIKGP